MKKTLLICVGVLFCLAKVQGQTREFKTKLANSKDKKVVMEMAAADVKIEGVASDDLVIQASSGFEAPPERAKGLKPLYYTGVDNTGIGLSVTTEGNVVKIEKVTRKEVKYTIRVPKQAGVLFQETNWQAWSSG